MRHIAVPYAKFRYTLRDEALATRTVPLRRWATRRTISEDSEPWLKAMVQAHMAVEMERTLGCAPRYSRYHEWPSSREVPPRWWQVLRRLRLRPREQRRLTNMSLDTICALVPEIDAFVELVRR